MPRRRSFASGVFVVLQVALCVVLLVAGGLLLRALRRAQSTDPGFDIKHVIATSLDLRVQHYSPEAAVEFDRRVIQRLETLPGVRSVALAAMVPLGTAFMASGITIEGHELEPGGRELMSVKTLCRRIIFVR